jgi:hypothetical protein
MSLRKYRPKCFPTCQKQYIKFSVEKVAYKLLTASVFVKKLPKKTIADWANFLPKLVTLLGTTQVDQKSPEMLLVFPVRRSDFCRCVVLNLFALLYIVSLGIVGKCGNDSRVNFTNFRGEKFLNINKFQTYFLIFGKSLIMEVRVKFN